MRLVISSVLLCLIAGLVQAGAWPRALGSTFVAFSVTGSGNPASFGTGAMEGYATLYVEHGVSARLTFGLDTGLDNSGASSVLAFARLPVGALDAETRFALKAGLGRGTTGIQGHTAVSFGVDVGRGVTTRLGDGWLSLETWAHYDAARGDLVLKGDLTAGLRITPRTKVMVQVQTGSYPGSDPYARLAPSVSHRISDRFSIELGAVAGLIGDDRVGLKLGTWLEF